MFGRLSSLAVVLVLTGGLRADVGDMEPAACPPGESLHMFWSVEQLSAGYNEFKAAKPESGTVNPHAVIASVTGATFYGNETSFTVGIDSKAATDKEPNVIRFDFSGQGKFSDKFSAPLKPVSADKDTFSATFGPAQMTVEQGGKTIPVTVQGRYEKQGQYRNLTMDFGTCLTGQCSFGGKAHSVRILDGNNNLHVGDKADVKPKALTRGKFTTGDTLVVDLGGGKEVKAFYGQPVRIDGQWWNVMLSPDGKKVSATKVEVQTGKIKIAQAGWSALLVGERHLLRIEGGLAPVEVPADSYRIGDYVQTIQAGGKEGKLARYDFVPLTIAPGKTTDFAAGPPITVKPDISVARGTANISLKVADVSGRDVRLDPLPPEPELEVRDAKGEVVHTGKMSYG